MSPSTSQVFYCFCRSCIGIPVLRTVVKRVGRCSTAWYSGTKFEGTKTLAVLSSSIIKGSDNFLELPLMLMLWLGRYCLSNCIPNPCWSKMTPKENGCFWQCIRFLISSTVSTTPIHGKSIDSTHLASLTNGWTVYDPVLMHGWRHPPDHLDLGTS